MSDRGFRVPVNLSWISRYLHMCPQCVTCPNSGWGATGPCFQSCAQRLITHTQLRLFWCLKAWPTLSDFLSWRPTVFCPNWGYTPHYHLSSTLSSSALFIFHLRHLLQVRGKWLFSLMRRAQITQAHVSASAGSFWMYLWTHVVRLCI